MNFKELISTLSKSAASAVSTPESPEHIKVIKQYLYVETEIEKKFIEWMELNKSNHRILFLCGSSGDGKSEILTRNQARYQSDFKFHLDGTHSYHPSQNAIETLDEQFSKHKESQQPLVVGINIGMLGNYCNEGDVKHQDVKNAMKTFLDEKTNKPPYEFLNFDDYPKYIVQDNKVMAPFIKELLAKITTDSEDNPFYKSYKEANGARGRKANFVKNYALLCESSVQQMIIQTILIARLKFNLFLTARTLLDAIYHFIDGEGYLFDNLFCSSGGELLEALQKLDPNNHRDKEVDMFLIHESLGINEGSFLTFKDQVKTDYGLTISSPESWLRFCYLIQESSLGNSYHKRFRKSFAGESLNAYIEIWLLHASYNGEQDMRNALRNYYKKHLISAVTRYANRQNPKLTQRSHFFLKKLNGYSFSTRLCIEPDLEKIKERACDKLGSFTVYLKIESKALKPIHIDADLFDLIIRINQGYRPNKYDKSAIVILEEVIEEIQNLGNRSSSLFIEGDLHELHLNYCGEYDEIQIEG